MKAITNNRTDNKRFAGTVKKDGAFYLTREGVLDVVELTDPKDIKPGPQRDWIIDFQRRRPSMSRAQALREVLERIGAPPEFMPKPAEVRP